MPGDEIILDYASPRPRGKLRLPARSVIRWEIDPDTNAATVTATLAGKDNAIAGLAFGVFTFLVISACATGEIAGLRRYPYSWPVALLCAAVAVAELVLIFMVIDQTWAKTTLRATREGLAFKTRSPFRRRELSWSEGEVLSVRLESTQDQPDAVPLGQVQIVTDRPPSPLTLFVDHLYRDLVSVTHAIQFGLGRVDTAPTHDRDPVTQMPSIQPDERTFDRLVDVHRQMRSRSNKLEKRE